MTEKKTHQWIVACNNLGEGGFKDPPTQVDATTKAQAVTSFLMERVPEATKKELTALRKVTTCVKVKTPRPRKVPQVGCPMCHQTLDKWDYPGHWGFCRVTFIRAPMSQGAQEFHK